MAKCWSCGVEDAGGVLCTNCGKIQPVGDQTLFEVLGLPARMAQDRSQIDRAFREASKRVHPDRFGGSDAVERRLAVEQTAHLNEAYRRLRDADGRAEYLLSLEGVTIGEETARTKDPAFLMDMMQEQEAIDESSDVDALELQRARVVERQGHAVAIAQRYFDEGEGTQSDVARALDQRRYLKRLVDRIDAKLEEMI